MDNIKKTNTKEEIEARDVEIYKAFTALNPWRPLEQNQPDTQAKGSGSFQYVKGLPDQVWVRDGDPIIQDNSFWRALAQARGGSQNLWPIYKYQTSHFLFTILDIPNTNLRRTHPRAVLYTVLNGHAGGRTSEHLKKEPAELIAQTVDSNAQVSSEMFQVIADLYSVELLVFYLRDYATQNKLHDVVARGQHNHRQIFLTCYIPPESTSTSTTTATSSTTPKYYYQSILPAVPKPWDFKFSAHMEGNKNLVNVKRCPFVFSAGKSSERIMPGIPDGTPRVPPPPIFPPPVPIRVGEDELKVYFRAYKGPSGDGAKAVLEPATAPGIERKISVKGGRDSSLEREKRSSVDGSSDPVAGTKVGANRTRSGSSVRESTKPSRRRVSETGKKRPPVTRSKMPSASGPSSTPPSRSNSRTYGTGSESSFGDSTESSRRRVSVKEKSRPPITRSKMPSASGPSSTPPSRSNSRTYGTGSELSFGDSTESSPRRVSETRKKRPPVINRSRTSSVGRTSPTPPARSGSRTDRTESS